MTFAPAEPRTPDRKPNRSRSRSTSSKAPLPSLRKELDQFIAQLNELLHAFDPIDALDDQEHAALVDALDKEARKNPRVHRLLQSILTFGGGGGLAFVVGIIVGRRLARRRMFGQFSPLVETLGGAAIGGMDVEPSEAAAAMRDVRAAVSDIFAGRPTDTAATAANGATPTG